MTETRRLALARREALGFSQTKLVTAAEVLEACSSATELPPFQDSGLPPAEERLRAVHHFAHFWLHHGKCACSADDLARSGIAESALLSKVDTGSAGPKHAAEAQAYAGELLLPGPLARKLFWDDDLTAVSIAESLGLSAAFVEWQMKDALLLPPPAEKTPQENKPGTPLDPFQQKAASTTRGPLLLGAGPGTGKTSTLIGRCQFLTGLQGVPPEKILALTFSRQAAQELRHRLADAGVGTPSARPWVCTFHGFGLEILRRFGDRLGLPAEIKLLDTLDAVTLLENHLPRLNLETLDNLFNPAVHLSGIVKQISRAKDELCSPERYAELCAAMSVEAERIAVEMEAKPGKKLKKDADAILRAREQAAKASEAAHCYGLYQELLTQEGFLDFADLISRTVELLESCPDVLSVLQTEYPHILADEYQDVNRACARLVRLLAGDEAEGLWAVGDHRQSIYRFRGASPANVAAFERDYPGGHRLELEVNYRSQAPIVDLFGTVAQVMDLEAVSPVWHAKRGTKSNNSFPAVTLAVAPDDDGQADGIAQAIKTLHAAGTSYGDQAILCRTHGQAEALAAHLSERDIPTLYLGALLERPEVKDLLCLLSLAEGTSDSSLLRVAAWPEYAVSQSDALAVLERAALETKPLGDVLLESTMPPGLQLLGKHLSALQTQLSNPAACLCQYLFSQSQFLRQLSTFETRPFLQRQQRLAIHQLIGLAEACDQRVVILKKTAPEKPNKTRDFLTHLRRLQAIGETLRGASPPEAGTVDAVRVLTAHAAKGLEYPIVFVPNLGAGQFPARGRHDGIPEPSGLADTAVVDTDEEECLFFVALSRARDVLVLSRSETSGTDRSIKPSPLLALLEPWFIRQGIPETLWPAGRISEASPGASVTPDILPTYTSSALELYGRCPRQYYYERVLKVTGLPPLSGYLKFHACVRLLLTWLEEERMEGRDPVHEILGVKLDAVWAEHGPTGHLHEMKYKDNAASMLQSAWEQKSCAGYETGGLQVTLASCRVKVRPDRMRFDAATKTLTVSRHLTGKRSDDDKNDKRLALYRRAARETFPERQLQIEIRYLSDGIVTEIDEPPTEYKAKQEADRVAKYDAAAQGIQAERFPTRTGDICQTCAYSMICPL